MAYSGAVLTIASPCILPVLPFVFMRADQPFLPSGLPMFIGMAMTLAHVAHLADVSLRYPDTGCMVVDGYSNYTRLKTHDPNWATPGYKPRDNADDYREMLYGNGIDVDAPDREEWEWPEHGGSFTHAAEHPVR